MTARRLLLAVMLLLVCAGVAHAQPGPYIGASVGQSEISDRSSALSLDFDEKDTGFKVFAGMRGKFLGLEIGYVDFGSPQGDVGAGLDAKINADGWDLIAIGTFPLGKHFEIFGKYGLVKWSTDVSISGSANDSDSGNDSMYGFGGVFKFGKHIAMRAEYEKYDVRDIDTVEMISAGMEWRF